MTQAHDGLKSLKLSRKPINTGIRFLSLVILFFQSKEKTIASILKISTISMSRHKEESLRGRSWVYKKFTGITQVACMRIARDAHRLLALELHAMCTGHVQTMCMKRACR